MKNMCGVVHRFLEGPIQVWKRLCTTTESQLFAEVITTFRTIIAVIAHDPGLDGDSLAGDEVLNRRSYGSNDTCSFVTQNEWRLESKIAVSAMEVVVHWFKGNFVSIQRLL
jgi:hypothetical protein